MHGVSSGANRGRRSLPMRSCGPASQPSCDLLAAFALVSLILVTDFLDTPGAKPEDMKVYMDVLDVIQWLHFNCLLSEIHPHLRVSKIWAFSTGKHTDDSLPNLQDKSPLGHSWRFGNKVFSKDLKDRYDSKQLWSSDFGKVAPCHPLPPKCLFHVAYKKSVLWLVC